MDNNSIMELLSYVGGKDNIKSVMHCMTRLRFHLFDVAKCSVDDIKKIKGVLGCQNSAGEIQVIIGPGVTEVYNAVCRIGGFEEQTAINENLDEKLTNGVGEKLTVKSALIQMLNAVSGCLSPIIPAFVVMGLLNLIAAVLGPSMLHVISDQSDLYLILYWTSKAILYFLPFFIAYTGAKKFGANIITSMILSAILLYPDFVARVETGGDFSIYGIPMTLAAYSGSVLPMIMITWCQAKIEKGLRKILPKMFHSIFLDLFTVLLLLPIGLCILGPIGQIAGSWLAGILMKLYEIAGPVETTIMGATRCILLGTGMAYPIFTLMLANFMQTGVDFAYLAIMAPYTGAIMGATLGYFLKTKKADQKKLALTCFASGMLGGVSEPAIFGILFVNRKTLIAQMIGGAVSGLYIGLTHTGFYTFAASNFMCVLAYAGGTTVNFINGCISYAIALIIPVIVLMIIGVDDREPLKNSRR